MLWWEKIMMAKVGMKRQIRRTLQREMMGAWAMVALMWRERRGHIWDIFGSSNPSSKKHS